MSSYTRTFCHELGRISVGVRDRVRNDGLMSKEKFCQMLIRHDMEYI